MVVILPTLNTLWVILCACFVFFMQAGFVFYEVGFVQSKNVISVALENLSTFMIASIGFLVVGFPLMFGTTVHGLFGNSLWGLQNLSQGPVSYTHLDVYKRQHAGWCRRLVDWDCFVAGRRTSSRLQRLL